jgi:hypothetical protein
MAFGVKADVQTSRATFLTSLWLRATLKLLSLAPEHQERVGDGRARSAGRSDGGLALGAAPAPAAVEKP